VRSISNHVRHEYWRVDPEIMWSVARHDLPALRTAVEGLLASLRTQAGRAGWKTRQLSGRAGMRARRRFASGGLSAHVLRDVGAIFEGYQKSSDKANLSDME
jgi:hypothetical protein